MPTRPQWGDASVSKDGKALYLHILHWPESDTINVTDLPATASSVVYLKNGDPAEFAQKGDTLKITLHDEPLNQYDTVLKVTFPANIDK
ncbi:hypothetical protein RSSM_02395 [Rhodopirellula sallentina SM41]|uniref:Alpha-L-fucosidase C-terminal domain-containing protein n=1 Tax=Rhodopirellula sallentina SM41 TaxID=1263870 RepID=M5UE58_9BACT|nr:hypothetical protein RSSM_02395 [Rhodopirellula sallentina SM41]